MEILVVQHTASETAGWWGEFWEEAGAHLRVVHAYLGENVPHKADGCAAVLTLGGPMNVYEEDEFPWLHDENVLIQSCLRSGLPFMGICLGAQLLAKAAGARVGRSPRTEIGWGEVQLADEGRSDPIFRDLPARFPVLHWHGDMFEVPASTSYGDAARLADSVGCPNQALRIGNNAYGLQFHIEVTPAMLDEWVSESTEYLAGQPSAQDGSEMCVQARHHQTQAKAISRRVFDNFNRLLL